MPTPTNPIVKTRFGYKLTDFVERPDERLTTLSTAALTRLATKLERPPASKSDKRLDRLDHDGACKLESRVNEEFKSPGHSYVHWVSGACVPLPIPLANQFRKERSAAEKAERAWVDEQISLRGDQKLGSKVRAIAPSADSYQLARTLSKATGFPLLDIDVGRHSDREGFARTESFRGHINEILLVSRTTYHCVDEQIMSDAQAIDAIRRCDKKIPLHYLTTCLPYARSDKPEDGEPPYDNRSTIAARIVLDILDRGNRGVDSIHTLDVHSPLNAATLDPLHDIQMGRALMRLAALIARPGEKVCVACPDATAAKRLSGIRLDDPRKLSEIFGENCRLTQMYKRRRAGQVDQHKPLDSSAFPGRNIYLLDDLLGTGGTVLSAARHSKDKGAKRVFVVATHPVGAMAALENLRTAVYQRKGSGPEYLIDGIITSDAVPLRGPKMRLSFDESHFEPFAAVLPVAPCLAVQIRRMALSDTMPAGPETSISQMGRQDFYTEAELCTSAKLGGFAIAG